MTNSAIKGIKCIVQISTFILLFNNCIPVAFNGVPVLNGSAPPTNTRTDLCNLLIKVGLEDQVQTCLTATDITDAQKAALCDAAAKLSEDDKNLLRANLPAEAINSCAVLGVPTASPTATTTAEPTVAPTVVPTSVATEEPTSAPTPTPTSTSPFGESTPVPTATAGTGGGGSNGGLGGGNSAGPQPTSLSANVVVTDAPLQPITASGSNNSD